MVALQALGIAMKLTFQGENQFVFIETYFCILVRIPSLVLLRDMLRVSSDGRHGMLGHCHHSESLLEPPIH